MIYPDTTSRSNDIEIMDDFDLKGDKLKDTLDKIARINQFLGGNSITLKAFKRLILKIPVSQKISICDVGCGNGDMLRTIADYGFQNNLQFELTGVDANAFTISYAEKLSEKYSNISYHCQDIFDKNFQELKFDVILCTLTLHHFKDEEILKLMSAFNDQSNIGIIINDLHRNSIAYRLYQALAWVLQLKEMPRQDGLTSILRGFKKEELIRFSEKLNLKKYKIRWKWAFRYEWIISKI